MESGREPTSDGAGAPNHWSEASAWGWTGGDGGCRVAGGIGPGRDREEIEDNRSGKRPVAGISSAVSVTSTPLLLRQSIGLLQRPVIVWITHGLGNYGSVTDSVAGQTFTLFNGEHARLAIGYDAYGIHTLDPIDGPQYDSWAVFTAPWSRFNYMEIIVGSPT
jgi:hypothetical protein